MTKQSDALPVSEIRREGRWSLVWIIPLIALGLAGWLGWQTWSSRGLLITLELERGHGLEQGAALRCRDVAIGEVRQLALSSDGETVVATIALDRRSSSIARSGSRFWVVRPQLGLDRIAGLDTIIGARYLEVAPGDGAPQRRFTALNEPPVVHAPQPGDLQIVLTAPARSGISRGAPVSYRQIRVGTVLSVGLTSDGGAVEIRAHIAQPYTALITSRTKFWPVSGLKADANLTGFELELESIETLLAGGIALATPPDAGPTVRTGHRFRLAPEAQEQWLEWVPQAVIGSAMLPPGAPLAAPMRSTLSWEKDRIGGLLTSDRRRDGWLLYVEGAPGDEPQLFGARPLLIAPDANEEPVSLDIAGQRFSVDASRIWSNEYLASMAAQLDGARPWSRSRTRRPAEPEDCIVVTDASLTPTPLAADRFRVSGDTWKIDDAVTLDAALDGGIVIARRDGAVIGVLLCGEDRDEDDQRVALLPGDSHEGRSHAP